MTPFCHSRERGNDENGCVLAFYEFVNLAFSGLRGWGSQHGFNSILREGLIHLMAPLFP